LDLRQSIGYRIKLLVQCATENQNRIWQRKHNSIWYDMLPVVAKNRLRLTKETRVFHAMNWVSCVHYPKPKPPQQRKRGNQFGRNNLSYEPTVTRSGTPIPGPYLRLHRLHYHRGFNLAANFANFFSSRFLHDGCHPLIARILGFLLHPGHTSGSLGCGGAVGRDGGAGRVNRGAGSNNACRGRYGER
jgi:hypothetical protein